MDQSLIKRDLSPSPRALMSRQSSSNSLIRLSSSSNVHFSHLPSQLSESQVEPVENLKELLDDSIVDVIVIDVRSQDEIKQGGRIDAKRWANIPMTEIEDALRSPADEFRERYDEDKPLRQQDEDVIVYCTQGNRGARAVQIAVDLGFRFKNLEGGFNEWKKKFPELVLHDEAV